MENFFCWESFKSVGWKFSFGNLRLELVPCLIEVNIQFKTCVRVSDIGGGKFLKFLKFLPKSLVFLFSSALHICSCIFHFHHFGSAKDIFSRHREKQSLNDSTKLSSFFTDGNRPNYRRSNRQYLLWANENCLQRWGKSTFPKNLQIPGVKSFFPPKSATR